MKFLTLLWGVWVIGISALCQNVNGDKACNDCHSSVTDKVYLHGALEGNACDNCHESNGQNHPQAGVSGFKLMDKVPDLCFYCHDANNTHTNVHYPVLEGECNSCHDVHSANHASLLVDNPVGNVCALCHDLEISNKPVQHYPAAEGECSVCHDPHASEQSFFLKQEKKNLCFECHEDIKQQSNLAVIHYPFDDDCGSCHQPHAGENAGLMNEKIPDLCLSCHDLNSKTHQHYPAAEGECLSCHSPHASAHQSLLIDTPAGNVCASCHDLEIPKTDVIHYPVKEGECSSCHDPHESDHPYFLKKEKKQLCFECHDNIKEQSATAYQHYPFEDDCANCHGSHNAPHDNLLIGESEALCYTCHDEMHSRIETDGHVHWPVINKEGCVACHSPHASDQPYFLVKESKELCLDCHNRSKRKGGRVVEAMSRKLKNSKYVHAALEMDGCVTCHDPHTAETGQLVKDVFPESDYTLAVADSFALCFSCHETALIENKITPDATGFREGQVNLHYLHINDGKGRSCAICHDVHASDNEHLIANDFSFGKEIMSMRYEHDDEGGSCFPGCHAQKDYDRERDVLPENFTSELLALLHEQSKGGAKLNMGKDMALVVGSQMKTTQLKPVRTNDETRPEAVLPEKSESSYEGKNIHRTEGVKLSLRIVAKKGDSSEMVSAMPVDSQVVTQRVANRTNWPAVALSAEDNRKGMVSGERDRNTSILADETSDVSSEHDVVGFLEYFNLIFIYSAPSIINEGDGGLDKLAELLLTEQRFQIKSIEGSGNELPSENNETEVVRIISNYNTQHEIFQRVDRNLDDNSKQKLLEMILIRPELLGELNMAFDGVSRSGVDNKSLEYQRIAEEYLEKYSNVGEE